MDLSHIHLPASVLAELYESSLVDISEITVNQVVAEVTEIHPADPAKWTCLGENKKNVLIIVNNHNAVHLTDEEFDFLSGILGACKLSMADVAIVNLISNPVTSYRELVDFFKSRIILLFGVEPASFGLPMSFPPFQIQPFARSSFLFSPSLKELENDKLLKSKLWVCLKRLFNI